MRGSIKTTMGVLTSAPTMRQRGSGTRLKAVNRIFMALFDFSGLVGCFMVKQASLKGLRLRRLRRQAGWSMSVAFG